MAKGSLTWKEENMISRLGGGGGGQGVSLMRITFIWCRKLQSKQLHLADPTDTYYTNQNLPFAFTGVGQFKVRLKPRWWSQDWPGVTGFFCSCFFLARKAANLGIWVAGPVCGEFFTETAATLWQPSSPERSKQNVRLWRGQTEVRVGILDCTFYFINLFFCGVAIIIQHHGLFGTAKWMRVRDVLWRHHHMVWSIGAYMFTVHYYDKLPCSLCSLSCHSLRSPNPFQVKFDRWIQS